MEVVEFKLTRSIDELVCPYLTLRKIEDCQMNVVVYIIGNDDITIFCNTMKRIRHRESTKVK